MVIVLIHSPLAGPLTWQLVADELRQRTIQVILPTLVDTEPVTAPYWQQHAAAAAQALEAVAMDQPVILIGHSGTGPLLPAIRQALNQPVAGYLFADAGLPHPASRLEMMAADSPEWAEQFKQFLAAGGRFPAWSDEELREIVPDAGLRLALLNELQPREMAFFVEPIPVFAGWPDAPCAYLQFTHFYDYSAAQARQYGWPYLKIEAGHFHMLVDPSAVAEAILHLIQEMGLTLT